MNWRWRKVVSYGSGVFGAALVSAGASTYLFNTAHSKDTLPSLDSSKANITTKSIPNNLNNIPCKNNDVKFKKAIEEAHEKCLRVKEVLGLPGLSIAVSVNGEVVWKEGFGYSDVENGIKMTPKSVIRIASISKSMTMAMMGKLMEEGKIDIDLPIQKYLPQFPMKTYEGKPVTITTRHLLSHLSGIRHYKTKAEVDKEKEDKSLVNNSGEKDAEFKEFFMKTGCETLEKAMELFKNDELFHQPGSKYLYSTHAWTVVSAIIEKLTDTPFPKHAKKMFDFWGLENTHLDEHDPIIYNRARHYSKDKKGHLINSPWVDNSCKWAGGGFLSNVLDLTKFAHIMMFSYQSSVDDESNKVKGFLSKDTMKQLWTGDPTTAQPNLDNLYALGFVVGEPFNKCFACKERDMINVSHSGGAVGATSILLMTFLPFNTDEKCKTKKTDLFDKPPLNGIVVAMITNLIEAPITVHAREIAQLFRSSVDNKRKGKFPSS